MAIALAPHDNLAAVLELPWLERLLLWAIRSWAAYHDEPAAVWWSLEQAFTEGGIRPALEPFEQMMSSTFAGLKRLPDIRCVRCLRLGRDERELLAVLALVMQERQQSAVQRLNRMLLPAAVRSSVVAAQEMMRTIKNSGLRMQQVPDDAADTTCLSSQPLHRGYHH